MLRYCLAAAVLLSSLALPQSGRPVRAVIGSATRDGASRPGSETAPSARKQLKRVVLKLPRKRAAGKNYTTPIHSVDAMERLPPSGARRHIDVVWSRTTDEDEPGDATDRFVYFFPAGRSKPAGKPTSARNHALFRSGGAAYALSWQSGGGSGAFSDVRVLRITAAGATVAAR